MRVTAMYLAFAALTGSGCLRDIRDIVFHCDSEHQCGAGGTCEPTGLCSFPDSACPAGRRYGSLAGDLAGQCVAEFILPDAGIDAPPIDSPVAAWCPRPALSPIQTCAR